MARARRRTHTHSKQRPLSCLPSLVRFWLSTCLTSSLLRDSVALRRSITHTSSERRGGEKGWRLRAGSSLSFSWQAGGGGRASVCVYELVSRPRKRPRPREWGGGRGRGVVSGTRARTLRGSGRGREGEREGEGCTRGGADAGMEREGATPRRTPAFFFVNSSRRACARTRLTRGPHSLCLPVPPPCAHTHQHQGTQGRGTCERTEKKGTHLAASRFFSLSLRVGPAPHARPHAMSHPGGASTVVPPEEDEFEEIEDDSALC